MSKPVAPKSPTPALIAKLGDQKRERRRKREPGKVTTTKALTFAQAVKYDSEKPGAEFVWTNAETMDTAEWNRQAKAFQALAPRLKRSVDHWSLSLDPRLGKLTLAQWEEGARAFLEDLGYQGCLATVYRHVDEPQDHIHISVIRLRFGKDGKIETVSDSHIYKRSHIAAERAARKLGLKPLPPRENAAQAPAPNDSQVAATKRAKRRGTPAAKHAALAKAVESAVVRSTSVSELVNKCAEIGVEVKVKTAEPSMATQGLSFRPVGVQEWTKASELNRDRSMSWSHLEPRLARNKELRARAQAEADRINAAARNSAASRVAARLALQPEHEIEIHHKARALPPAAAHQAKEAAMSDTTLDFLNPPPPPRPADQPLDDAGLLPFTSAASSASDAAAQHKKKLDTDQQDRDRANAQAEAELAAKLKTLSVAELLDLKSAVPPFLLTAAAIEALVNFLIKLLSAGLVRRTNVLGQALSANEQIRVHAEEELQRRRRSPSTVAGKKHALNEYAGALAERDKMLDDRRTLRTMPNPNAEAHRARAAADLRARARAEFDIERAAAELPTLADVQAEYNAAREAHRRARAEAELVPTGFAGPLVTRAQRDALAAAKAAAALALKNAAARRDQTRQQLQQLLDQVEAIAIEQEQQAAEQAAAAAKSEKAERQDIERELRSLPDQIREFGAAAERAQLRDRAVELVDELNRPKTAAELAAAEAERLRLLDLANRRG